MVGEMNSAVSLVDFDRMLNGLDRIYSEFARTCGLSDCAYWDARRHECGGRKRCRESADE